MNNITKKPLFWLLFSILSLTCIIFTYRYFSQAFPLVQLDLKMDRPAALAKAKELAQRQGWGPADYSQAASFEVDTVVKNFVELEAGGIEGFAQMLKEPYYKPYAWKVRHFKEFNKNETIILFTAE